MAKSTSGSKDSFVDLERHRLRLEENVAKLQKSLQHWQTWEAEYEGMKEEIGGLNDKHTDTELAHAATESVGTLLNEKEVKLLLKDDKGQRRDSSQIVGLLSRRIDYVQQNVKTVTSLLDAAEEKLVASAVISRPGVHNEEGLPLTEIREELDEDGNIISSSTNAPGDAAPQVVEALRKVGIKGLPETPERISQSDISFIDQEDQAWVTEFRGDTPTTSILKSPKMQESGDPDTVSGDSAHESNELKPTSRRKSVTFAEGTKSTDAPSSKPKIPGNRRALKTINEIKRQAGLTKIPDRTIKPNKSSNRTSKKQLETGKAGNARQGISGLLMQERAYDARIDSTKIGQKDTDTAVGKSEPPVEIVPGPTSNEQSSYESSYEENTPLKHPPHKEVEVQDVDLALPITPIDESAEDTALRRQMLAYSMNEVGAVVAEIELDEEDEDRSDASNTDDEDGVNSDASSTEEDEDEHGRTKRPVLDDAYLEEMRALEERLNATAIQNVGPDGNGLTAPIMEIARSTTTRDSSLKDLSNTPAESSIPKQVRFVEELDVQNGLLKDHSNGIVKPISKPVKDDIVERVTPWDRFAEPTAAPKKKVSRFKNARAGNPTVSSTKAESDKPVADTLMERNIPKISTSPQSASNQYHFPDHTALASSQSLRQAPTGPPNRTHAPTVVERSYSAITDPSKAVGPDELDPALLHQQVATEYHRIRNRMIQRQGGFLATDEEKEYVPLAEEEGGAPKISRFKAARLAQLR